MSYANAVIFAISIHKSVYSSYQTLPYVEETFVFLGSRPPVIIKFLYGMWKTNVEIDRQTVASHLLIWCVNECSSVPETLSELHDSVPTACTQ